MRRPGVQGTRPDKDAMPCPASSLLDREEGVMLVWLANSLQTADGAGAIPLASPDAVTQGSGGVCCRAGSRTCQ